MAADGQRARMQPPTYVDPFSLSSNSNSTSVLSHSLFTPRHEGVSAVGGASMMAQSPLDFSIHDERVNGSMMDEDSAIVRARQLATQLRHTKSELARKDVQLANLQQQVSELNRMQEEYANARIAWERREQQTTLREQEYEQRLSDMQTTLHALSTGESQLRAALSAAQQEKLNIERESTVQLGEMDARVTTLRSELDSKCSQLKHATSDLSGARREIERLQSSVSAMEETHESVHKAMEQKYFQTKAELTNSQDELTEAKKALNHSRGEASELASRLEERDAEIALHLRNKTTQAAMIDSLSRELSELQKERSNLKMQVDEIPPLKDELAALHSLRDELRTTQRNLNKSEERLQANNAQLELAGKENASLKHLVDELEKQVADARERYVTLTAPTGELESARSRNQLLEHELRQMHQHATKVTQQLEEAVTSYGRTKSQIDDANQYIISTHTALQRIIELALQLRSIGDNAEGVESSQRRIANERNTIEQGMTSALTPPALNDNIKPSISNLRSSLSALFTSHSQLHSQHQVLQAEIESTRAATQKSQRDQTDLHDQLRTAQLETQLTQQKLKSEHDQLQQTQEQLHTTRHEITELRKQIEQQQRDLDERTTVARLWALEMENLVRNIGQQVPAAADDESDSPPTSPKRSHRSRSSAIHSHSPSPSSPYIINEGHSALTADGPLVGNEHWPSVRTAVNDIVYRLAQRVRTALTELQDCNRSRTQQRQDLVRLSEQIATLTQQVQEQAETVREAKETAAAAVQDADSIRMSEIGRVSQEADARCDAMRESYEKIISNLQQQSQGNTQEIIDLTRRNHNLLTATRLFYKGYKPLFHRVQELLLQKAILTRLYHDGLREHDAIRQLMLALTAKSSVNSPTGVRASTNPPRALFRAGVIAILAARRLRFGRRRDNQFGETMLVRGQQVAIIDNSQISNNTDLPGVDDMNAANSAQSLLQLLNHFDPTSKQSSTPSSQSSSRSLLDRLSTVRVYGRSRYHGVEGQSGEHGEVAIVRRIALELASSNQTLQRDLQLAESERWRAREEAKKLLSDMQSTHAQIVQLEREAVQRERERSSKMEVELRQLHSQFQQLQEQLNAAKQVREDDARAKHALKSELSSVKQQLNSLLEQHHHMLEAASDERETKLNEYSKRLAELSDENSELQSYVRKRTNEIAAMERAVKESTELHAELKHNLDISLHSNQQMKERIKVLESELMEHRQFSQRLKSAAMQSESSRHELELTLSHLHAELRDKEHELTKSQEIIRTLTEATRAATNELDSQLAMNRQTGNRPTHQHLLAPYSASASLYHHPPPSLSSPSTSTSASAASASASSSSTAALPSSHNGQHLVHPAVQSQTRAADSSGGSISTQAERTTQQRLRQQQQQQQQRDIDASLLFDDLPSDAVPHRSRNS